MWITFRDVGHQELVVQAAQIDAIILPSPISVGDGKFRIVAAQGRVIAEVSQATAHEMRRRLLNADLDDDVRLAAPLSPMTS